MCMRVRLIEPLCMVTTKRDRQTEIDGISSEKRGARAQPCDTDSLESDV